MKEILTTISYHEDKCSAKFTTSGGWWWELLFAKMGKYTVQS